MWRLIFSGIGMPLGSVTMRKWLAEQSVTPTLALGGEVFWLGQQRKSGIGFAGRYNTDKAVQILCLFATLQLVQIFDCSHPCRSTLLCASLVNVYKKIDQSTQER
jgi:hypothetical protein